METPTTSERKTLGSAPWIILGLWVAWLAALVAMSVPEWGKSKRDLIETKEAPTRQK